MAALGIVASFQFFPQLGAYFKLKSRMQLMSRGGQSSLFVTTNDEFSAIGGGYSRNWLYQLTALASKSMTLF
jgi:hypothetical protein